MHLTMGESLNTPSMSYQEISEDVIRFLDKNRLEKIILLGHSMVEKLQFILH